MHKASEGVNVMFLDTLIQSGGIIMNKSMSSKVVALDEMQSDWMSITMVMVVFFAKLLCSDLPQWHCTTAW